MPMVCYSKSHVLILTGGGCCLLSYLGSWPAFELVQQPADRVQLSHDVPFAYDGPFVSARDARRQASKRARQIVGPAVASTLFESVDYGGLVALPDALGPGVVRRMRCEAEGWRKNGKMSTAGQEKIGRSDIISHVGARDTAALGMLGLAYGISFMHGVCGLLNRHKPKGHPTLVPQRAQLSCFDGRGRRYPRHFDNPVGPEARPVARAPGSVSARRVTMILYLQPAWRPDWYGALRAFDLPADSNERSLASYVDIEPVGGTLVLFRSRDLWHEVRPTASRRFALTVWCQDAPDR